MNKSTQQQLLNLVEMATSQKRYPQVIDLANKYILNFQNQQKICKMHMVKAKAYSQMNQPSKSIQEADCAIKNGADFKEAAQIKIRGFIQCGNLEEAQNVINSILEQDQYLSTIFKFSKAIQMMKDQFKNHRLSEKEQKILEEMRQWLQKSGARHQKLKVVNVYPGYRGAIATRHIKKGQPIVFVPKNQLITLEMAKKNKICANLIANRVQLQSPKHTFMSILLLELRSDPSSKFKPYIDLLPSDHSFFPINYTNNELNLLQGSPFLNMILQKVIDIKKDYDTITKTDQNTSKYSFRDFCWARMMVGSRVFGLLISGVKTQVLVPFADMLNHRQPKQTVWNYQESMNGFVIESLQEIQVGQQVFDSYGKKCNSRFLLNYGFVLKNNVDNEISVRITIKQNDPLAKQKKEMIHESVDLPFGQVKKINNNFNNNKFYELMGCLRFICVRHIDKINTLKKISNMAVTKLPYIMVRTPPISVQNQTEVWTVLKEILSEQLSKYPTKLQNDIQKLRNDKNTNNEYNILMLIIGEKQILTKFIKICDDVIEILKNENLIEALSKNIQKPFAKYLYKILSLLPGINKKAVQKVLGPFFNKQNEQSIIEDTQQVAEC